MTENGAHLGGEQDLGGSKDGWSRWEVTGSLPMSELHLNQTERGKRTREPTQLLYVMQHFQAEVSVILKEKMRLYLISAIYKAFCTKNFTMLKKKSVCHDNLMRQILVLWAEEPWFRVGEACPRSWSW